jgi:CYTH domain-containing protein
MAKEIERKFLVSNSAWRNSAEAEIRIRQFYLAAAPGRTIRIRISDGADAMLTLKFSGKGRGRDEFEYPVPLAEAEEMQAFALGRMIEKTRFHVRHDGYLYEVDVFEGQLAGLVIAELETPDIVPADRLPPWLGPEVTHEGRYYNASLALNTVPELAL